VGSQRDGAGTENGIQGHIGLLAGSPNRIQHRSTFWQSTQKEEGGRRGKESGSTEKRGENRGLGRG